MIVLFSDFGLAGPYLGQVRAVLGLRAPAVTVIDMLADAPRFDPRAGAYLLAAYASAYPAGAVILAVVDPGVGTDRPAIVVRAGGRIFVGPGNGLTELVMRRDPAARVAEIVWRPDALSASFHGRDLFAPVAADLALGRPVACRDLPAAAIARPDWPDDLAEIVYADRFGNLVTGMRAGTLPPEAVLSVAGRRVHRARTFAEVPAGGLLWYRNANGLAEIACNQGSAQKVLSAEIGTRIETAPN